MKKIFKIFTLAILLLMAEFNFANAQWEEIFNQKKGSIRCLTTDSNRNIFAGTIEGGIFLSTDYGTNWTVRNEGINNLHIRTIVINGSKIYAGSFGGGIFYSTNYGLNWLDINNGLSIFQKKITSIAISDTNIYVGTFRDGVLLSTNNGSSWNEKKEGMLLFDIYTLKTIGKDIFACTSDGVFLSTNNGSFWAHTSKGLNTGRIFSIAKNDSNIFVGSIGSGIFVSTNYGSSWTSINDSLNSKEVVAIVVKGSHIFAGTENGVFYSSNNGKLWSKFNNGLTDLNVWSMAIDSIYVYTGTKNGSIFRAKLSDIITSVDDKRFGELAKINIFPNPSNDYLFIEIKDSDVNLPEIQFFDIMGNRIELVKEMLSNETIKINIENLPIGIYNVSIKSGMKIENRIFVKN